MIRFRRGVEPQELADLRQKRISLAVKAYNRYGEGAKELADALDGYNILPVKDRLFLAQGRKCAWCELRRHPSGSPIDHFRPKNGTWRNLPNAPRQVDRGHYWWLTWTWTNLLFVCSRCNNQGRKANYFPLEVGSAAVALPRRPHSGRRGVKFFDVSTERSMLIDPAVEDPLDHIIWKPLQTNLERKDWKWSPSWLTPRGKATVQILKLDEISDEVQHHLRVAVLPSIEEMEGHFSANRTADGLARWTTLVTNTLAPEAPLSAASWCALEIWTPAAERTRLGLPHPRRPGH